MGFYRKARPLKIIHLLFYSSNGKVVLEWSDVTKLFIKTNAPAPRGA